MIIDAPTTGMFDIDAALRTVDRILSQPPSRDWIDRPEPRGFRVARFVLPLSCLEPQNRRSHAPDWAMRAKRQKIWQVLALQRGELRRQPLPGRPQILCCRFSSVCPDRYADSFKAAVDALCVPKGRRKHGLGWIADDSPKHVDVVQWWEYAAPKRGFGLIEIYTGKTA